MTRASHLTQDFTAFFVFMLLAALTLGGCREEASETGSPNALRPTVISPNELSGATAGSSVLTMQALLSHDGNEFGYVPIFANANMDSQVFSVQRAIVVLHDASRDPNEGSQAILSAIANAGGNVRTETTLVVAPWFVASDANLPASFAAKPTLVWSDNGFMAGFSATSGGNVSSFAAIDELLKRFADSDQFPALQTVFVVGHSAGGQTTDRYAIGGKEPRRWSASEPNLRFAVANPSSYTYFDPNRPQAGGGFAALDSNTCAGFDTWKYGIKSMPSYFSAVITVDLVKDYRKRHVTHLLGTADTNPNLPALDRSCCAKAQGSSHYVRGQNYKNYLMRFADGANNAFCEVQGVGHDTAAMLSSNCLLTVLQDN